MINHRPSTINHQLSANLPTFQPSNLPTFQPSTFQPSLPNLPTFQPSNLPTFQPSNLPTFQPSNLPTLLTCSHHGIGNESRVSSLEPRAPSDQRNRRQRSAAFSSIWPARMPNVRVASRSGGSGSCSARAASRSWKAARSPSRSRYRATRTRWVRRPPRPRPRPARPAGSRRRGRIRQAGVQLQPRQGQAENSVKKIRRPCSGFSRAS